MKRAPALTRPVYAQLFAGSYLSSSNSQLITAVKVRAAAPARYHASWPSHGNPGERHGAVAGRGAACRRRQRSETANICPGTSRGRTGHASIAERLTLFTINHIQKLPKGEKSTFLFLLIFLSLNLFLSSLVYQWSLDTTVCFRLDSYSLCPHRPCKSERRVERPRLISGDSPPTLTLTRCSKLCPNMSR